MSEQSRIRTWARRLTTALAAVLVLIVLSPAGLYLWFRLGVPQGDGGTLRIAGLDGPVEVLEDANAVPHIFAESTADAYFALGFLHARHRLWQMEMQRRLAQGRLSEILGEVTLPRDRRMRTFGLYRSAETSLDALPSDVRTALRRYADGINHFLTDPTETLPIEFWITHHQPEPWQPADSVVWFKTMALMLSTNYTSELLHAVLNRRLGGAALTDLLPFMRGTGPITMPELVPPATARRTSGRDLHEEPTRTGCGGKPPRAELPQPSAEPLPLGVRASNGWVISGALTESGAPILANDPHLPLGAPVLWYLARIVTPELSLTGVTVPGMPFHLLGHNGEIAWGMTTTGTDVQDLFCETVNPDDPTQYRTPDGWATFETRIETIQVRNAEPVELEVRSSRHGPILSDVDNGARKVAGRRHAMALRFTALDSDDTTATGLFRLNRARSWADTTHALSSIVGPQQNLFYADTAGNIGLAALARVPIRPRASGLVPVSGASGQDDWIGYVPMSELPQGLNPRRGWYANANNAIVGDDYPHQLTSEWETPYRIRRVEDLIRTHTRDGRRYTVEDARRMQLDIRSEAALALLPHLLQTKTGDPRASLALDLLRDWPGNMDRDRPEPLIFHLWLRSLNEALYADELGSAFPWYRGRRPQTVLHMLTRVTRWCDDVRSSAVVEDCAEILRRSLDQGLQVGIELYGDDLRRWRWGDAHRATLEHRLLTNIPILGSLFDIGIETDGSNFTLNRGASYARAVEPSVDAPPFTHAHGSGLRAIYDLADLDNSRFVIATGQSGNPFSPDYDGLVAAWRDGDYIRIAGSREELSRSARGVLRLVPVGE